MGHLLMTRKELVALLFLAEMDDIGGVQVERYVDDRGIGWIKATIGRAVGTHNRTYYPYKVSPLGHIYSFTTDECLYEYGKFPWKEKSR